MNNLCIIGRMTADPETKTTQNGHTVLSFSVAVPRPHTKDTTDFIRCVAWRSTAEFIQKYFHKGKMIAIIGVLTSRSWKDEQDKNHSLMEVVVESVDFCGDKNKQEDLPKGFSATDEPDVEF